MVDLLENKALVRREDGDFEIVVEETNRAIVIVVTSNREGLTDCYKSLEQDRPTATASSHLDKCRLPFIDGRSTIEINAREIQTIHIVTLVTSTTIKKEVGTQGAVCALEQFFPLRGHPLLTR